MDAPNFSGDYPGSGERIGPLWRALWAHLTPGRFISLEALTERFAAAHNVQPKTVHGLLWQAVQCGHLEKEYRTRRGARRVYYRRAPKK